MVDIQLYDSLELVKTFQRSVVGEKGERQVNVILLNSIKDCFLGNLTVQMCMCFFLSLQ